MLIRLGMYVQSLRVGDNCIMSKGLGLLLLNKESNCGREVIVLLSACCELDNSWLIL